MLVTNNSTIIYNVGGMRIINNEENVFKRIVSVLVENNTNFTSTNNNSSNFNLTLKIEKTKIKELDREGFIFTQMQNFIHFEKSYYAAIDDNLNFHIYDTKENIYEVLSILI